MTDLRITRVTAPEAYRNVFPLCGCERVCLQCGAGCVGQCAERHGAIQCQEQRGHHVAHNAEIKTSKGWVRLTWEAEHVGV